ncbi:MAG TPA: extracellular matrix/biofilm biosynthesis regulator RemA family protein [Dehalococcoidia bacterium]|nr:extracellular matrix/biofilm biosynthesis regulator RemA family protein [Dehalococcoidia bacterium]
MGAELVHIGFGSVIAVNRVIAFFSIDQQPIKRIIRETREKGLLIDATHGRKAKTAILFDTNHIVLAAVTAETIAHRLATPSLSGEERD